MYFELIAKTLYNNILTKKTKNIQKERRPTMKSQ